jgi:hypothetical protein
MEDLNYKEANDKSTEMKTLTTCLQRAVKDGYTENFTVTKQGLCAADNCTYSPEDVQVVDFFRFEGESDPADNTILYIIECKGKKGTIVDAYGHYSDGLVSSFMTRVQEQHKKMAGS